MSGEIKNILEIFLGNKGKEMDFPRVLRYENGLSVGKRKTSGFSGH